MSAMWIRTEPGHSAVGQFVVKALSRSAGETTVSIRYAKLGIDEEASNDYQDAPSGVRVAQKRKLGLCIRQCNVLSRL